MEVLVFKTNIGNAEQVNVVRTLLSHFPGIYKFNFDLDDCDRILRVAEHSVCPETVTMLLKTAGVECREL